MALPTDSVEVPKFHKKRVFLYMNLYKFPFKMSSGYK